MVNAVPAITDVIFHFCGVVVDWQSRAGLEGHYPQELVDRICSDDDEFGFFDYEDRMDHGASLAEVLPSVEQDHGKEIADIFEDYITRYDDSLVRLLPGSERLLCGRVGRGEDVQAQRRFLRAGTATFWHRSRKVGILR